MRKKVFLTGMFSLVLAFALFVSACKTEDSGGGGSSGPAVVTLRAIAGVTPPVTGGTPVTAINDTEYSGTVTWAPALPADGKFAANTAYTATITLTAKEGYTFTGVTANYFSVTGANPVTNAADSGTVTAVFPATGAAPVAQGTLTVFNMSVDQVRVNVTPPPPAGGGLATVVRFNINAYAKGSQTLPIANGYSVTVTNNGESPPWTGAITASETMLEFSDAGGGVGNLTAVGVGTLSTPTGGQAAATLTLKNEGVSAPIVKIQIEEQADATKRDVKYDSVAVAGTQTWALISSVKYKVTIWIAPVTGGIQVREGYFMLLGTSGNISYDGANFTATTAGDTTITVSPNPLP
jgi:hypothetical protein